MEKYVTISEARQKLTKLLSNLASNIVIMKNGKPVAVIMSIEEHRALKALAAQAAPILNKS